MSKKEDPEDKIQKDVIDESVHFQGEVKESLIANQSERVTQTLNQIKGEGNIQITNPVINLNLPHSTSLLAQLLPVLVEMKNSSSSQAISSLKEYKPGEKLNYNDIKKYRYHITTSYAELAFLIDNAYEEIDNQIPHGKERILSYFATQYEEIKAELYQEIPEEKKDEKNSLLELIQSRSDDILDQVQEKIREDLSEALPKGIYIEDLKVWIIPLICHAFVECRILEKPE